MRFASMILIAFAFLGCHKQKVDKSAPKCIDGKINDFAKTSCSSGAHVDQFTFQSQTVFVFDPGKCGADMTSPVYDSNCNALGMLGGIAGNTKINGEDFSHATFVKTVWKN